MELPLLSWSNQLWTTIQPSIYTPRLRHELFHHITSMARPPMDSSNTVIRCPYSRTIALSSTEAGYRGAVVATCEAIWLKRLLKDLHEEMSDPTVIQCDNLNSIQLAKTLFFMHGQSTSKCTIILSESESFPVKSNYNMFRRIDRLATSSPSPLDWTSYGISRVRSGCVTSTCRT
jgi:hypothetical protein